MSDQQKNEEIKPHIGLSKGQVPERVLVCGDPARAEWISTLLEKAKPLAKKREYHSYQGTYNGVPVLVMSHGVGCPGAMIGFQELADLGARVMIRVGTAGGLQDHQSIGDLLVAHSAARQEGVTPLMVPVEVPAVADLELTLQLKETLLKHQARVHVGACVTSDVFYPGVLDTGLAKFRDSKLQGVEMELSGLYILGLLRGIRTAGVCVLDGNPLKWDTGEYDPSGKKMKEGLERAVKGALQTLADAEVDAR